MYPISIHSEYLLLMSLITFGVGFTLFRYSADGDLSLANYENANLKRNQVWNRVRSLTRQPLTEVTWNTSLFIAFVSSLMFLGLSSYMQTPHASSGIAWILSLFTVYALQDTVHRWKSAHRKNRVVAEHSALLDRLQYTQE